jgi:hypothetical protein
LAKNSQVEKNGPLLSDVIGTRINKKGGGSDDYNDDDRSASGQQTLMSMFSPACNDEKQIGY